MKRYDDSKSLFTLRRERKRECAGTGGLRKVGRAAHWFYVGRSNGRATEQGVAAIEPDGGGAGAVHRRTERAAADRWRDDAGDFEPFARRGLRSRSRMVENHRQANDAHR